MSSLLDDNDSTPAVIVRQLTSILLPLAFGFLIKRMDRWVNKSQLKVDNVHIPPPISDSEASQTTVLGN